MRQRPILFSTPMVQAILDGRKTQTRRVVKVKRPLYLFVEDGVPYETTDKGTSPSNPYGQPGDVLWVRETFCKLPKAAWAYKASTDTIGEEIRQDYLKSGAKWAKWKPSIHMPKEAARIWLEVVSVKVERLQDISEEDAKAEGAFDMNCGVHGITMHKAGFEDLWKSINGSESWNANPWVFVVEFKRIDKYK